MRTGWGSRAGTARGHKGKRDADENGMRGCIMKLRVCILTYWGENYATNSVREALQRREHELIVLSPTECSVSISCDKSRLISRGQVIDGINVVLTRCVAHFHNGRLINRNLEALAAMALMKQGAIAINQPENKLIANDKMHSLVLLESQGIKVPPTIFAASAEEVFDAGRSVDYPLVIKLTEGLWGAGVMRVDSETSFRSVSEAFLNLGLPLLIQPYLLTEHSQQLRVLVLGDDILAAYETRPGKGDFRGNLHAGATPTPVTVSATIADTSIASSRALGLDFAGVDLIVNDDSVYVIEVNPAPGFNFVMRAMPEVDVANSLVDYLEKALERPAPEREQ